MENLKKAIAHLRIKLAMWIAGPIPRLAKQVDATYEAIWPKHDAYEVATKVTLTRAIFKAHLYGQRKAEARLPRHAAVGKTAHTLVLDDVGMVEEKGSTTPEQLVKQWDITQGPKDWLVWSIEHQAWWNGNRIGYTTSREQAGRFSFEGAFEIVQDANLVAGDKPSEAMVPDAN